MKKIIPFILLINLIQHPIFAQKNKMDSLNLELNKATQDTARLNIYHALCDACEIEDNLKYAEPALVLADKLISEAKTKEEKNKILKKKADVYIYFGAYYQVKGTSYTAKELEYIQKRLAIFQEMEDKDGIKNSLMEVADYYNNQGNTYKRLETLKYGLSLFEKWNNKKGISRFTVQISFLYADQGDTAQALDYMDKAIKLEKEINDTSRNSRGIFLIGVFYNKIHRYDKALEYYYKAIPRFEAVKDYVSLGDIYSEIGISYKEKGDLTKAIESFTKSFEYAQKESKLGAMGMCLLMSGEAYSLQGNYAKAIECHQRALSISIENKFDAGVGLSCYYLAKDYLSQKKYKEAKQNINRSLAAEKKMGMLQNLRDGEQLAATIDSATNNYKEAYSHYQQYITLRDKLNNVEVHKAALRDKFQSDNEKQKVIDKAEQDKKDTIAKAESKKQKLITFFVGLGLLIVLVFAGFVFRSLRIRNKQNKIIVEQKTIVEEKQKEILDSIEYALRIQTAILPPQKIVKQYLENSFILYKPKDIVAGDFYWMETINDLVLFAACDCTGHGVPGAMVSVVCHNALNRAVREFGLTTPSLILDKTAEIVIENFSKSEEDIKDGMDISLCSYNTKTKELNWAGANNPLWLLQNGELIETKADKQPIGMNEDSKPFTNHTFTLNATDTIYLFTDGFADQFGGDTGEKKLTKRRFKDLLLSVQTKSLQEQESILDKFIVEYRKEVEQIDDILVMGVKV